MGAAAPSCRAARSRSTSTASRAGAASTRRFKGVHWSELAKLVRSEAERRFVVAHAEQGFTANMPLDALEDENALIAYEADGEPLTPDHGGPVRLMVPRAYFWKSAKWLPGLELLDHDEPGLLGALRLPQRRGLLAGAALLVLSPFERAKPSKHRRGLAGEPGSAALADSRRSRRHRRRSSSWWWTPPAWSHGRPAAGDLAADLARLVLRRVHVDVRAAGEQRRRTLAVKRAVPRAPDAHGPQSGTATGPATPGLPRCTCAATPCRVSFEKVSRQDERRARQASRELARRRSALLRRGLLGPRSPARGRA